MSSAEDLQQGQAVTQASASAADNAPDPASGNPLDLASLYLRCHLGGNSVRVLIVHGGRFGDRIDCDLLAVDLDDVDDAGFDALSYCWGGEEKPETIWINGIRCPVTSNLYQGLQYLRPASADASLRIWVDAVCINQDDIPERNSQVARMGDIYRNAEMVHVWLGGPSDRSKEAIEYFNTMRDTYHRPGVFQESFATHEALWHEIHEEVLKRDWWRRTWIVQEFILAKKAEFVCGDQRIDSDLFYGILAHAFSNYLRKFRYDIEEELYRKLLNASVSSISLGRIRQLYRTPEWNSRDLCSWIVRFDTQKTTRRHDRVYAFMGLASECSLVPQEELPWQDVYRDTTRLILEERRKVDFVCLGQGVMREPSLPSWIPDLAMDPTHKLARPALSCDEREPAFDASEGRDFEGRVIGNTLEAMGYHPSGLVVEQLSCINDEENESLAKSARMVYGANMERFFDAYPRKPSEGYPRAVIKTMIWDLNLTYDRCRPEEDYFDRDGDEPLPEDWMPGVEEEQRALAYETALYKNYTQFRRGRRMALFGDGSIGMVPPNAEVGDVVVVLAGASVPMILSPQGEGQYRFLGVCYVHGIMDGEVFQQATKPMEMFRLV